MFNTQSLGPSRLLEKVWDDVHANETPNRLLLVADWLASPGESGLKRELCDRAAQVATKCLDLLDDQSKGAQTKGGCAAILLLATVAWLDGGDGGYRWAHLITDTLMGTHPRDPHAHHTAKITVSSAHILLRATQKLVSVCLRGLYALPPSPIGDDPYSGLKSKTKWQTLLCRLLTSVFTALESCDTTVLGNEWVAFSQNVLHGLPQVVHTRLQERINASSIQLFLEPLYEAMVGIQPVDNVATELMARIIEECIQPQLEFSVNPILNSCKSILALVAACGMRSAILKVSNGGNHEVLKSLLDTVECLIASQVDVPCEAHRDFFQQSALGNGLVARTICGWYCPLVVPFRTPGGDEKFVSKLAYCICEASTTLGVSFAVQGLHLEIGENIARKWEAMLGPLTQRASSSCPGAQGDLRNLLITYYEICAYDINWLYRVAVRMQISQHLLTDVHRRLSTLFDSIFIVLDKMIGEMSIWSKSSLNPLPGQVLDLAARLQFCRPTSPPSSSYSRVLKATLMGLPQDPDSTLFLIQSSFQSDNFYDELLTDYTAAECLTRGEGDHHTGGVCQWYADNVIASQVQFLLMALEPCVGENTNSSAEHVKGAVKECLLPVALLYIQHFHPPTSQAAHKLIWALLQNFESYFESTIELENFAGFYVNRCLEACTLSWNDHTVSMLAQGLGTLVRSVGMVAGTDGSYPIAIRCIDQVIEASAESSSGGDVRASLAIGNREELFTIAVAQLAWVHYGLLDILCQRLEKYHNTDPSLWRAIGRVVASMNNCVRKPKLVDWYRNVGLPRRYPPA